MKLILSRKGFDSAAGGCPSPILPDGRLCSLPIPDTQSGITYGDLKLPPGLIPAITRGRLNDNSGAHLDPDIERRSLPRPRGWHPLFGQFGAAQSHLRNQGVGTGDLFLFFGLFRQLEQQQGHWRWQTNAPKVHVFWGWLQVGQVIALKPGTTVPNWMRYHPHVGRSDLPGNTLYRATRELTLNGRSTGLPGAGSFCRYHPALQLTAAASERVSRWHLPRWFHPSQGKPALSYHQRPERWALRPRCTELQAAARGQEFVLDGDHYPQAARWAQRLIEKHARVA